MRQRGSCIIGRAECLMSPGRFGVICTGVPPLAVDKVLAAADELRAHFTGYFVFACRITKSQQLGNRQ
ncbi:hypothetical protein JOB18_021609 [Solea senegalensis]|uniref:Uncharacterized protein n=1 Tax=Solea senegalensis TaxID=28829 RepID=A0AAV6SA93_SOLSE|nr:hypothetical protein JOB18_021609 [Solea senegalensis]